MSIDQVFFYYYRYFDACAELNQKNGGTLDLGDGLKPIDFKVNPQSVSFASYCYKKYMNACRVNQ